MVISASDGWTSADAIIFERIWGPEGILRQRKEQAGGVLAGPMAPPTEVASVTNVGGLILLSCFISLVNIPELYPDVICVMDMII